MCLTLLGQGEQHYAIDLQALVNLSIALSAPNQG